ncbi:hypothetical protein J1614_011079 [Plenodomus biglobosus]|nr:hypothetical protein J1614_011079 [Plenodomus biglobosus]
MNSHNSLICLHSYTVFNIRSWPFFDFSSQRSVFLLLVLLQQGQLATGYVRQVVPQWSWHAILQPASPGALQLGHLLLLLSLPAILLSVVARLRVQPCFWARRHRKSPELFSIPNVDSSMNRMRNQG